MLIAYLIPDIPGPVKLAIEREEYLRKIALEGEKSTALSMSEDELQATLRDSRP